MEGLWGLTDTMTKIAALPEEDIIELLVRAKMPYEDYDHSYMRSGGNNNIFYLTLARQDYIIKQYKNDPNDLRDRLGTEWNFLQALFSASDVIPCPRPISKSSSKNLALYSFVKGEKLNSQDIIKPHIQQTCSFIQQINSKKIRKTGIDLGNASESSFSLKGHLDLLFTRLEELSCSKDETEEFRAFMDKLTYTSKQIAENILCETDEPLREIDMEVRILSPSDFGFHNALYDSQQKQLNFIDFEYAGWDDPAKTVSDFFFQPQTPVCDNFYALFLESCVSHLPTDKAEYHRIRINLMRPIFGLRWCCIILKPFTRDWQNFAWQAGQSQKDMDKLKTNRLSSAKKMWQKTTALAGL